MADPATIPSPSVFLEPSVELAQAPPRANNKAATEVSTVNGREGHPKPKQSKSRNGCVTCKAKRLKCDETKPACVQCAKRKVTCGGYKKDFKWRPFEESTFAYKPPVGKARKVSSHANVQSIPVCMSPTDSGLPIATYSGPTIPSDLHMPQQIYSPDVVRPCIYASSTSSTDGYGRNPPPHPNCQRSEAATPGDTVSQFQQSSLSSNVSLLGEGDTVPSATTTPSSISSGQSPRLVDLLLPGTDMHTPSEEYLSFRAQHAEYLYHAPGFNQQPVLEEFEDVEEIVRQPDLVGNDSWVVRMSSPAPSSSSSSSGGSNRVLTGIRTLSLQQPRFASGSPEMLMLRFDRQTCGILSLKDGPTENPWRTLIWPLARDCPALYHAIASMTSFHSSQQVPGMRLQGIEHMRTSVQALASNIQDMRLDTALATTLALAFSESWDQHTTTGIDHIKGAKILLNQALVRQNESPGSGEDLARLLFLCRTWVYMDVIARLTSVENDESNDFDTVFSITDPTGGDAELDPLMGCASTLFPLVGRVANLVRRVRKTPSTSPAIISQAIELKESLERWNPPAYLEDPEDPTTNIQHSVQTAEAYRWATLLYLHQAVPEIPSRPSSYLAKKVMIYLATVPMSSGAIIVHIYPLLAAGCEAVEDEDRSWVRNRWMLMARRMAIGNIDRCLEVTKEVWDRRGAHEAEKRAIQAGRQQLMAVAGLKRNLTLNEEELLEPSGWGSSFETLSSPSLKRRATSDTFDIQRPLKLGRLRKASADLGGCSMDAAYTVRGHLHWCGVMKDWGWEGKCIVVYSLLWSFAD